MLQALLLLGDKNLALSYTRPPMLLWGMPFPDDDEPEWKRTGVAVEFWALNVLIVGALIYGLFEGVRSAL